MRRIAVIGLSTFGMSLVNALTREGARVLAVDNQPGKIDAIREVTYDAVIADARDARALQALQLENYDAVVLSLGQPLDASLLALLHLRDLEVKPIIAKAESAEHRRLLLGLGADEVVFPEDDIAERHAHVLANPGFLGTWEIGEDVAMAETAPGETIIGHSLGELDLPEEYGIIVVAIRDNLDESIEINPGPSRTVRDSDSLIVFGKQVDVDRFVKRT